MSSNRAFLAFTIAALVASAPCGLRAQEEPRDASRADDRQTVWRSERVCGLNCLYFLLRAYGKAPDYLSMQRNLVRPDLTSLYDLGAAAKQHGVPLRLASMTPKELSAVPKPAIAHLDVTSVRGQTSGHFVVVTHATPEGVRFIDGTTAETREFTWRDFQRDWSGNVAYREPTLGGNSAVVSMSAALVVGMACGLGIVQLLRRCRKPACAVA